MANQKIALIVDDEEEVVEVVRDALKTDLHYLVVAATDPTTAEDMAESYVFDLLILDLHMPKLDGFQVLDLVRKKQPNIKVVVITALYELYATRLENIKVDRVIEKPLAFPEFQNEIVAVAGAVSESPKCETKLVPRAKILLVDTDAGQLETLQDFMLADKPNHYEIEIADNGSEALRLVKEFCPDVVVFDVELPHLRGEEMFEAVQAGDGHKPKLFIVLSALMLMETIERLKAQGCLYVTKPFRLEELLGKIRNKCLELELVTHAR